MHGLSLAYNTGMKDYNQSPLPFQGQKRGFSKSFKSCLKHYDDSYTFVDLFGGSGLLSHIAKHTFPKAEVVYNDYDDFENMKNTCTICFVYLYNLFS